MHPGLQDSRRDHCEALHEGMTVDEVLGAYPYLDAEDIEQALAWAATEGERELSGPPS